ncbi:MAG: DUF5674 family protein [Candidatus Omnitrophica bacterium]|nr:DUF5674 family protein [Candidatus Omnitrophota bacterium]
MIIISESREKEDILKNHNHFFKTLIKGVVDLEKGILALDAELHADLEQSLLEKGSQQNNIWGINLYLTRPKEKK